MRRAWLVAILCLQAQDNLGADIDDDTEEAIESAEIHLGGVAEQIRTFSFDSVKGSYADGFRGEVFFNPLPADTPARDLGMGVKEWRVEEKGRKKAPGDLPKNLDELASIEDVQFKFPSGTFESPRLKCRLKITLVGRARDGSCAMWQEEYDSVLRHDAGRWEIALCDRVLSRRQRAERGCFVDDANGLMLPFKERNQPSPWDEPYASLGGVSAGDYDGDGDDDLFYPCIGNIHLFRNDDGKFTEATAEAGLSHDGSAASALFIDYDNDGDVDLFLASHETKHVRVEGKLKENPRPAFRLWRNDKGRFTDVTEASKLTGQGPTTSSCAADYDGDGDLDIFVAFYADVINPEQANIGNMPAGNLTDSRDGFPDQLWRNNGDGTFTEVAAQAGVADKGRGYACAWGDFDSDGRPDLYVANDFGRTGSYRNKGDGTFEIFEPARDRGFGMGVAFGDIDNDGKDEIYVSNMYSTAGNRVLGRNPQSLTEEQKRRLLKNARGNTMLKARGDGTFEDVTAASNTARAGWAWSCGFGDLDLDGRLDLYVSSGYITGTTRADL